MGIIYLIQPSSFAKNTYKIGMSESNSLKRIKNYGKETICYLILQCKNDTHIEIEKKCIIEFKKNFILIQGNEIFMGDIDKMMMIIISEIYKKEQSNIKQSTLSFNSKEKKLSFNNKINLSYIPTPKYKESYLFEKINVDSDSEDEMDNIPKNLTLSEFDENFLKIGREINYSRKSN